MNVQETKIKVLKSASELISTQGYHNVSVREICDAAGVTKPVLYYYFKDKEDLLAELIKEEHRRFKELIEKYINPESSLEENLNGLYKVYESYAETYPYLIRVRVHVQLSPVPQKIKMLSDKQSKESLKLITSVFTKWKNEFFGSNVEMDMLVYSLVAPLGVIIAQTVLFKNNTKPLKANLKKYFNFWKSHFLKKRKLRE
jgi:AcrR family transcriptional regulator